MSRVCRKPPKINRRQARPALAFMTMSQRWGFPLGTLVLLLSVGCASRERTLQPAAPPTPIASSPGAVASSVPQVVGGQPQNDAAPDATAPLSTPAPIAFPCQVDAQCMAHRCNTQVGKCAWPCQSNSDCNPGYQCMAPYCMPSGAAN